MKECLQFYIDGRWVDPVQAQTLDVINPASEEPMGRIAMGSAADVDQAVAAAQAAFESFSQTSVEERTALFDKIIEVYQSRYDEMAEIISQEMGAPLSFSKAAQAATGLAHFKQAKRILKGYEFEENRGTTRVRKEPIGVCGFITPWNWPVNQIAIKVAPALAAGCTIVLKPSEVAPFNAMLLTEILDAARPAGRCLQRRQRQWADRRRRHLGPSRHRHGVVHRLDPGRHPGGPGRGAQCQARGPGIGRQVGQHRAR